MLLKFVFTVCISLVISVPVPDVNVNAELHMQSKSIAQGFSSTMLPRGTVLMIASDIVDDFFNMKGKGLGEYNGII